MILQGSVCFVEDTESAHGRPCQSSVSAHFRLSRHLPISLSDTTSLDGGIIEPVCDMDITYLPLDVWISISFLLTVQDILALRTVRKHCTSILMAPD
jgi:hypothetical protein